MTDLKKLSRGGRVLKIAQMGHPILRTVCDSIDIKKDYDSTMEHMRDMAATVLDYGAAAGLAAPQVYIPKRILFYEYPGERGDDDYPDGVPPTFLVNACYKPATDKKISFWEGCLSLDGWMGWVPRYDIIRLTAQRFKGDHFVSVDREIRGYHARILQHEIDHLDGILYVDRIKDFTRYGRREIVTRYYGRNGKKID